jgi:hypothetical protein
VRTLGERAPDVVRSYREMARRTAERAVQAGRLGQAQAAALIETLEQP